MEIGLGVVGIVVDVSDPRPKMIGHLPQTWVAFR